MALLVTVVGATGAAHGADAPQGVPTPVAEPASVNEAWELLRAGRVADAEHLARQLLADAECEHGTDSFETVGPATVVVQALMAQGREVASERRALAERVLSMTEDALGPNDPLVAPSLDLLAGVLGRDGDLRSARALHERSLALLEAHLGSDHPHVARGLNKLVGLLRDAGDVAAARGYAERALALSERVFGSDHVEVASNLTNLANLLGQERDFASARPLQERALSILEAARGPDDADVGTAVGNLGQTLQAAGDLRGARPYLERALLIQEKALGTDHPSLVPTLASLGRLLSDTFELDTARHLLERAVAIREKAVGPRHPHLGVSLTALATVLQASGDLPAARRLFERTLSINEAVPGDNGHRIAASCSNLALLLRELGDLDTARRLLERAVVLEEQALGSEHLVVASILNNMAVVLGDQEDWTGSRRLHERALAIREKALSPTDALVAVSLNNLGLAMERLGDPAAATRLHERALAIRETTLGREHPEVATSLNHLAGIHWRAGALGEARSLLERVVAIRTTAQGAHHPDRAAALQRLATVLAATGDVATALDLALESESVRRAHVARTARALSEREALQLAAHAQGGLAVALSIAATGAAGADRAAVLDAIVRARALVLDEMSARHRAAALDGGETAGAARLAWLAASRRVSAIAVRGAGAMPPDAYRRLLDDASAELERAERTLGERSETFRDEARRAAIGLEDIASSLERGDALVSVSRYAHGLVATRLADDPLPGIEPPRTTWRYVAFVLRGGAREPQVVPLGAADELERLVEAWRSSITSPAAATQVGRSAGLALRGAAWDPVVPHLGDARRVFVVPDGALHLVNFAALPAEGVGFLVEGGPLIHHLSAERDVVPIREDRAVGIGLLALGGPAYDDAGSFAAVRTSSVAVAAARPAPAAQVASLAPFRGERSSCDTLADMRFAPLRAATDEAREVARLWKRRGDGAAVVLDAATATETSFKAQAPGRRLLHVATHGFFLGGACASALDAGQDDARSMMSLGSGAPRIVGDNPLLLSGLALAGVNLRDRAGPEDEDGILTAQEVASLDLRGVEWAVLSACGTGLGDVRAGEGVLGLERAFRVAGARTVIMSLWSVDDEATRHWMKELYSAHLASELDTAESVRAASVAVLRDRRSKGLDDSPFWWGAFVASGDWQ